MDNGIVEGMNSTDHLRWFYIISVMKTGRLITPNIIHIYSTLIKEQYLQEQIGKVAERLEDIFKEARLVQQDQAFHPYTACTQMHALYNNKW